MYGSWDTECDGQNFLSFWAIFCLFTPPPPTTQKIKILKKWKNLLVILFYMCNIMTIIWFSWYEAQPTEFFVILGRFLPFYLPNDQENQNFGKMKKAAEDIIILHMCTIGDGQMMYGYWDMELTDRIFCHFGSFFALLSLWRPGKSKFC